MQEPTIINVFDNSQGSKDIHIIDLASPFSLDRIKADYITIPAGISKKLTVPPKRNHFCYLLSGSGQLEVANHKLPLTKDDCFSFAESDNERVYTLLASDEGSGSILLVIQDTRDRNSAKKVWLLLLDVREPSDTSVEGARQ
jgi:hypothetical protein